MPKYINMKYCAKCGALLQDDSAFCGKCGHKVGTPVTNKKNPKRPSMILPSLSVKKIAMNKKQIICGLGIFAIVIIMLFIFTMQQSNSSSHNEYPSNPSYREEPTEQRNDPPSNEYDEDEEVSESESSVDMDEPIACPWCSGQGVTPFGEFCNDCGGSG